MSTVIQIVGSILLAIIPAIIWGYIFYKKNPENRHMVALTFILGAIAVFPILIYKFLWQFFPWINAFNLADNYQSDFIGFSNIIAIPLSVIITFMLVGLIEEVMKLLSVRVIDNEEIESVDDAMEFFIIAALGFSFTENVLYFYNIWITQGAQDLFLPFLFRSSFSTFAHLVFSGILGYYYGLAHFAKPILQQELINKRKGVTKVFFKIINRRKTREFYQEKILEGLLISIGLHAIFNIILEMNLTFVIVPFLFGGYLTLNYLFKKKENHKNYKHFLKRVRNHS